jgi:ADP-ribose pyrophosphatase YjhB (NUDIX family)
MEQSLFKHTEPEVADLPVELRMAVMGLVSFGEWIVVVRQQSADDAHEVWTPPAGKVEPGEMLLDAVRREIHEEAGLVVDQSAGLVFVSQQKLILPTKVEMWTVLGFEFILTEAPVLSASDPDEIVSEAVLMPIPEAIEIVEQTALGVISVPFTEYCKNGRGEVALYQWDVDLRPGGEIGLDRVL